MRNHRKIRALRDKFGNEAYAIYCMLLEYLTEREGNCFNGNEQEYELLAGDFSVSVEKLLDILSYCTKLGLFVCEGGIYYSEGLDERLKFVHDKREASQKRSETQPRANGRFSLGDTVHTVDAVTDSPQSKVEDSIVEDSNNGSYFNHKIENTNTVAPLLAYSSASLSDQNSTSLSKKVAVPIAIEKIIEIAMDDNRWMKANKATKENLLRFNEHLEKQGIINKTLPEYKRYFANWKRVEDSKPPAYDPRKIFV